MIGIVRDADSGVVLAKVFSGGSMVKGVSMKLIPALVLTVFSGAASASGFQLFEQNASGIGNAYAGSAAVAENASTIYFNPAGMTQLQRLEVSGGVSVMSRMKSFRRRARRRPGAAACRWRGRPRNAR